MAKLDLAQTMKTHIEALNAKDWNRYKAMIAEDAVYEEEATGRIARGPDEIVELIKGWVTAFPDLRGTVREIATAGDRVVAEVLWEGTHKGPLAGPSGALPATGKTGKVLAAEVVTFQNGRIRALHHYFDMMTILRQLGAAPGAQPQQPQP